MTGNVIQDVHWDEYARAGFTCWPPGAPDSSRTGSARPISVAPHPDRRVEGTFPLDAPASFLTAHNPGGPAIDGAENDRRHRALLSDVAAHGWHWWLAVGGDPVGSHTEEGILLLDASVDDAISLAARFDQDAIYVWSAEKFELLACDGSRHDRFGWTAKVGVTRLPRP